MTVSWPLKKKGRPDGLGGRPSGQGKAGRGQAALASLIGTTFDGRAWPTAQPSA